LIFPGVAEMAEPTLQELASRLAVVEAMVGVTPPKPTKNWRLAVGSFSQPEFHAQVLAEAAAIREEDREAGRRGEQP
jgi:hypothetical protein